MTLTLNLSPEIEQYLIQEAHQQGLSVEALALQLLSNSILLKQKQTEAVNLLQSWLDSEDEEEQQETGEYLIQVLDGDRWRLVQLLLSSIQQETLVPNPPTTTVNSLAELNPWTQSLIGVVQLVIEEPTECYVDYLEEKYS
ncbi:MAG: hypothetical protein SAJ12_12880 [Jaaginema sp. PMC 1079.18]|nr:hypothetical protein [Jaaginema sp. PMC 1080.18]MEC4851900.1 hypothetical protein [Jaaginema sp. PMC 1079.18]MEC4865218.1 hypothetical protein [Jaaginema sp. PMC 1078.18]